MWPDSQVPSEQEQVGRAVAFSHLKSALGDFEIARASIIESHAAQNELYPDRKAATKFTYDTARVLLKELEARGSEIEVSGFGQLFEVDIPEDNELMDWDAPFSFQPELLKTDALRAVADDEIVDEWIERDATGQEVYRELSNVLRSDRAASEALAAAGIKGHKYSSGQLSGGSGRSINFVIYDDAAIEIAQKFFQGQANDPRAQIALNSETNEAFVALLNASDLSSFQHELAHWFLHQNIVAHKLGLADEGMAADLQKIMEWLGVSNVDDLTKPYADGRLAPDGQVDKPHEVWARGYEQYLLDGHAPFEDAKELFARYREWIKQAYGGIKSAARAFGVPLTPEIVEVYDRLFIVDAVVDETLGGFEQPLFDNPQDYGFESEEDPAWKRYLKQWILHKEAAFQEVAKSKIAEVRAERRELRVALREQFRQDAEAEVASDPGWQAMRFLKRGELPDGTKVDGIKGLDRDGLRSLFWDEADQIIEQLLGRADQGRGRNLVAPKGKEGMDPEWVAEQFGFGSAREMIEAILLARTAEQLIQEQVNRDIAKSDTFTEEGVQEEAEAAAVLDREALYATELRRLRLLASGEILAVARRAVADTGAPAAPVSQALADQARERLDQIDPADEQDAADAQAQSASATAQATAAREGRRAQAAAARTVAAIEQRLKAGVLKVRARAPERGEYAPIDT